MDAEEFRQRGTVKFEVDSLYDVDPSGREMVDYIADYLTNIRSRRVFPNVKPGYMRPLIDEEAPRQGEPWENIFNDIERVIMPGVRDLPIRHLCSIASALQVTHWESPYMHAYFPALNSYPSLLGVRTILEPDIVQFHHFFAFY